MQTHRLQIGGLGIDGSGKSLHETTLRLIRTAFCPSRYLLTLPPKTRPVALRVDL